MPRRPDPTRSYRGPRWWRLELIRAHTRRALASIWIQSWTQVVPGLVPYASRIQDRTQTGPIQDSIWIQGWPHMGPDLVPDRSRSGSTWVQIWSRSGLHVGPDLVSTWVHIWSPHGSRSGPTWVQIWIYMGPDLDLYGSRSGSIRGENLKTHYTKPAEHTTQNRQNTQLKTSQTHGPKFRFSEFWHTDRGELIIPRYSVYPREQPRRNGARRPNHATQNPRTHDSKAAEHTTQNQQNTRPGRAPSMWIQGRIRTGPTLVSTWVQAWPHMGPDLDPYGSRSGSAWVQIWSPHGSRSMGPDLDLYGSRSGSI